jgi:hypothetical protein
MLDFKHVFSFDWIECGFSQISYSAQLMSQHEDYFYYEKIQIAYCTSTIVEAVFL